jgi:hypothetical protein
VKSEIVAAVVVYTYVPACIATNRLEKMVSSYSKNNLGEHESSITKETKL